MALLDFLKRKELAEISELKKKLERYSNLISIEDEVSNKKKEFDSVQSEINTLNVDYKSFRDIYAKLKKEISLYESRLEMSEFGLYQPEYDFEKSEDYRIEQAKIIEQQKQLIKEDTAAICTTSWTVENSKAKGVAMVNRYKKLMLRAFNGECDSFVSKVKWNNIEQMKQRTQKSFDAINKLGESTHVHINKKYLALKEKELVLEHEYHLKRQKEKEEMRAIQEELREEEKARREFEQAQKEAEKAEANYQKALHKAYQEIMLVTGDKQRQLQEKIDKLESELFEAQEKKERAISMAQQTKRGYVYIISNIGSFGESVYKIGMTRRLEPMDRVRELGDASVPFLFDVHAMIYSDEARTLEYELHKAFSEKKVNMLNYRREFFRVTLEEIEAKIKELGFDAEFTLLPEAMEYRETLALLEKMKSKTGMKTVEDLVKEEFPDILV
ncbi:DUF4041 domain-containing protein [Emticicia fontis]